MKLISLILFLCLSCLAQGAPKPPPPIYVTNYVYIKTTNYVFQTNYLYFNQTNWQYQIYNTTNWLAYTNAVPGVTNHLNVTNFIYTTTVITQTNFVNYTNQWTPSPGYVWTNLVVNGTFTMNSNGPPGLIQTLNGSTVTGHLP